MEPRTALSSTVEEWLAGPVLLPELDLYMPFAGGANPYPLPDLRRHGEDWLRSFDLIRGNEQLDRFQHHSAAELAVLSHPGASEHGIELAADLLAMTIVLDDYPDTVTTGGGDPTAFTHVTGELVRLTLEPPGTEPASTAHPAVRAFADVWARETEGMSRSWQARAGANWRSWFSTWIVEVDIHRTGHTPTLDEYAFHRREGNASGPFRDFVESVNRCECPAAVADSVQMRGIFEAFADCVGLVNDIYSHRVDTARKDTRNIISLLEHSRGIGHTEALAEAARRNNAATVRLCALADSLPMLYDAYELAAEPRATSERFLRGLGDSLRAHWEFCRRSARFGHATLAGDGTYAYRAGAAPLRQSRPHGEPSGPRTTDEVGR